MPYIGVIPPALGRRGDYHADVAAGKDPEHSAFVHTGGLVGVVGGGFLGAKATTKALMPIASKGLGLKATTATAVLLATGPKGWILFGCILAVSGAVAVVAVSYRRGFFLHSETKSRSTLKFSLISQVLSKQGSTVQLHCRHTH